ncbi:GNAT family N-acetyltransferase [Neobacillus mesonae]|nr:GNAT family N-acetyltransferase [Neobacillus mesonae]
MENSIYIPKALQGKHIYLRPVSVQDAEAYYQLLFQSETRRLTGTKAMFTYDQIVSYFEDKTSDRSSLLMLISLQDGNDIIGDIALQDIDTTNRSTNLRIMIDPSEQQGKGYGTEALKLMLDYAFGILQMHRVELNVFDYNDRAKHVYEKIGFKVEGRQRDALFYNHAYHDSILMSILEHEYRQLHLPDYKG